MLLIRKIDYHTQFYLGILMLISIPVLLIYGFLAGLFVLGILQLISAAFNTSAFIHTEFKKEIFTYWKCTAIDLLVLFLCWPLGHLFDMDDVQVVFWIGVAGSPFIAAYYLKIYNSLISHLDLRNELSGLTKSKMLL